MTLSTLNARRVQSLILFNNKPKKKNKRKFSGKRYLLTQHT